MDLCKPLYEERRKSVAGRLDDEIERIHKEGGDEKEEEGLKRDDHGGNNMGGGGGGRGTHPWRTPLTTTRYTASFPPEVLLLLSTKTTPSMTMAKRGAWWECFSSGYAQWETWRTYPN